MSAIPDASIDGQRRLLREKMRLQRLAIEEQLGPSGADAGFPRSWTMRLLVRRPGLVASVLAGIAEVFLGARHAQAATAATALSRIVRAAAGDGARRPRTERRRP